jgi:hypothetical protein
MSILMLKFTIQGPFNETDPKLRAVCGKKFEKGTRKVEKKKEEMRKERNRKERSRKQRGK